MENRISGRARYFPWIFLGAVILLNLWLKLRNAGVTSLYLDEAISIFYSQKDAADFSAFLERDASPPLYYWLLRGWVQLVGDDAGALRSLSVLFSTLAAVGIFQLGRRFFSLFVGSLAVLLFTFSNLQFQYAQEIRCYALLGMLTVWSMYFFLGLLRDHRWTDLVGLMLVNVGIAATHYAGLPVLLVQGAVALTCVVGARQHFGRYVLSQLPLVLFALVFIGQDLNENKMHATGWLEAPTLKLLLQMLSPFSGNLGLAAVMLLVIAAGGAIYLRGQQKRRESAWRIQLGVLAWPVLGLLSAWLISQWMPFFMAKYLAHIGIGWLVLVAVAVEKFAIVRPAHHLAAVGLVVVGIFLFSGKKKLLEDWKGAAQVVKEFQQDGLVIVTPHYQLKTLAYYLDRAAFRSDAELGPEMKKRNMLGVNRLDEVFFDSKNDVRVLLLQSHTAVTDPEKQSKKLLEQRLHLQWTKQLKAIEVSLFEGKKGL